MAVADAGYQVKSLRVKPDISAGIALFSGDNDPFDNEYRVFDTMYATNHGKYGFMDYFTNIPVHTKGLGLQDIHCRISIDPFSKTNIAASLHYFTSREKYVVPYVYKPGLQKLKNYGPELDLTFIYNYNRNLSFTGGISFFSPFQIFKYDRGYDTSHWMYLMTTLNLN
jgi:hypothetical protein